MALRRLIVVALVATGIATTATGPLAGAGAQTPTAKLPKYATSGRYASGVTTLPLPDRAVEVWYPTRRRSVTGAEPAGYDLRDKLPPAVAAVVAPDADLTLRTAAYRDAPAARTTRGFPLVLLGHGTGGYRESMSYLAAHLASWGFVVAAPDITEEGLAAVLGSPAPNPRAGTDVLRDTATLLRAENDRAGGLLPKRIRRGSVAVVGESSGGTTALELGNGPGVLAAVAISASGYDADRGGFLPFPAVPTMFVTGAADAIVPVSNVEAGFRSASPPTRFLAIDGAARATLTDVCPIGGEGGLIAVAARTGLPVPAAVQQLAFDGCQAGTPSEAVWPVVRHAVTAALREAFGIDRRPVGLRARAFRRFAPVTVHYEERL